jgi:tetratricopeptide (TPR) repeat protein
LKAGTRASIGEAMQLYERALTISPGFAEAYLAMANAYDVAREQRGVADSEALAKIEYYSRRALDLDPNLGLAYCYLGQARRNSGHFEQAERLLRKGLAVDPGNARILHALGLTLRLRGHAEEAIPYYDRAVRLDPYSPIINESRGSLLRDLGRFKEAEQQYQKTLAIAPDFVNTYWGLGTLYWSMGEPRRAIPWFASAVRLTPQGDVFRTWLALMYMAVLEDERAQAVVDETTQTVPIDADNDIVLAEELLRIYHGKDVSRLPDGRDFMMRYWYGHVLDLPDRAVLDGHFATAVKHYEKRFPGISSGGLTIDARNAEAAIYVAYALDMLGERERAVRLLDETQASLKGVPRLGLHGYWVADAQILAIRGDTRGSLQKLQAAVHDGWRNLWRFYLLNDPVLRPLHGMAGYKELVAQVRQEMTPPDDAQDATR